MPCHPRLDIRSCNPDHTSSLRSREAYASSRFSSSLLASPSILASLRASQYEAILQIRSTHAISYSALTNKFRHSLPPKLSAGSSRRTRTALSDSHIHATIRPVHESRPRRNRCLPFPLLETSFPRPSVSPTNDVSPILHIHKPLSGTHLTFQSN